MEGPHGQLGAGFTDRLGGHDADGFAQIHQLVVGQSPAVALTAHRAGGLAGKRRAHLDCFDTTFLDPARQDRIDLTIAINQDFAVICNHGLGCQAADQPGAKPAFLIGIDRNAAGCTAVVFPHDHVLGNVYQATGEVAGVGCTQCRVHQTLAGAIGGDHVFGDRQTLAEVGANRQVDDFPLGVGHQAAHAHQLAHLGHVAPGTGVGHHPHRVEWIVLVEVAAHGRHQAFVGFGPGVDDLGVALNLGDLAEPIALFGFSDLLLGFSQQGSFVTRNAQVVDGDRNGGLGGVVEAEILELIGHGGRSCRSVVLVSPRDQIAQRLLVDDAVAEGWRLLAKGFARLQCCCSSNFQSGGLGGLLGTLLGGFLSWCDSHGCAQLIDVRGRKTETRNLESGTAVRSQPRRR